MFTRTQRRSTNAVSVNVGMKRHRELTFRQRRVIAEFTHNGGNQTQACAAAGYTDPNAVAARVFRHPLVRAEIRRLTEAGGITEERWAQELRALMDAETPRGEPDNRIRLRAVTLLCRLRGWLDRPRREQIAREVVEQVVTIVADLIPAERHVELQQRLTAIVPQ